MNTSYGTSQAQCLAGLIALVPYIYTRPPMAGRPSPPWWRRSEIYLTTARYALNLNPLILRILLDGRAVFQAPVTVAHTCMHCTGIGICSRWIGSSSPIHLSLGALSDRSLTGPTFIKNALIGTSRLLFRIRAPLLAARLTLHVARLKEKT